MTERQFKTTLWAIIIIFLVLATGAIIFVIVYQPVKTGGAGVRIAILDSGLDMDAKLATYKVSKELKDATILMQKSFVTTEYGYAQNKSYVDDTQYRHGSTVALTIAGRTVGIAPQAGLIIARCADTDGSATYSSIIAAFNWAVDVGKADIINISLGGEIVQNDTLIDLINQAALTKGVITVISAGNSGDEEGYATTSIEGPGDALQAITVGAEDYTGIASYSSIGPMKDHSIKPDLIDSGYALYLVGTSFSAPKVVGKAALLIEWCRSQNYKTTPGLIKAALMASAWETSTYNEYEAGAGHANVETAKAIITNSPKVSGMPILYYVNPNTIPFLIDTVFQGDIWTYPLTVITSIDQDFTVTKDVNSIVSMPSVFTVNQTALVNCQLIIADNYTVGSYLETIILENDFATTHNITVDVAIAQPDLRIGFDVYHSAWTFDHLLGQFYEMRNYLAQGSVALIELTHPDNFTDLSSFDAVFITDPCSYGAEMNGTYDTVAYYRTFSNDTIDSLVDYVDDGNGLFIISTSENAAELSEVNKLVNNFNVSIDALTVPYEMVVDGNGNPNIELITNLSTTHEITDDVYSFDYFGSGINITGDNAEAIAWGTISVEVDLSTVEFSIPIVAAFVSTNNSEGRVCIIGSNFFMDNMGINDAYTSSSQNSLFLQRVVEWITNSTLISLMPMDAISITAKTYTQLHNELSLNSIGQITTTQIAITAVTLPTITIAVVEKKRRR
ncbi:MAG: S8 family peptidase [Candidatus Heimdallarchaeota archaeon]